MPAAGKSRVISLGILLAVLGVVLLPASALLYRNALLPLRPALLTFLAGGILSALGAALTLVGAAVASGRARGLTIVLVCLLGLAGAGIVLRAFLIARSVPRIHDITTDTENPPRFVYLRAERERSPNGAEYGGPAVAAAQKQAYPDIRPVVLPLPPQRALFRAASALPVLGADGTAGISLGLEGTVTSCWFGFKDDFVIRITPVKGGSRVDMRSASRVGQGDVGANARRIRAYLAALQQPGGVSPPWQTTVICNRIGNWFGDVKAGWGR